MNAMGFKSTAHNSTQSVLHDIHVIDKTSWCTLSAKRIIVSSLAIFFVDHVADAIVALNSESESKRV